LGRINIAAWGIAAIAARGVGILIAIVYQWAEKKIFNLVRTSPVAIVK
jgi:hypothetical protein